MPACPAGAQSREARRRGTGSGDGQGCATSGPHILRDHSVSSRVRFSAGPHNTAPHPSSPAPTPASLGVPQPVSRVPPSCTTPHPSVRNPCPQFPHLNPWGKSPSCQDPAAPHFLFLLAPQRRGRAAPRGAGMGQGREGGFRDQAGLAPSPAVSLNIHGDLGWSLKFSRLQFPNL